MSLGSWPYIPGQCPRCTYFQPLTPPVTDESGYQILGFCRHPRIAMELFRPRQLRISQTERCPLFIAQRRPSA